MNWRESTNQQPGAATVVNAADYLNRLPPSPSPIDTFYQTSRDILSVATVPFVQQHPTVSSLLLVGLVSATENYLRDLLGRLIVVCPISQKASAANKIDLGSVFWHGGGPAIARGAFEYLSLAGSKNVVDTLKKFVDYQVATGTSISAALEQFDVVCELRHCLVHSGAILAGKNAVRLQIPPQRHALVVRPDYARIQDCAAVCTTVVTSLNTELFGEFTKRWAVGWRRLPSWEPKRATQRFRQLWGIFFSATDAGQKTISTPISRQECQAAAAKDLMQLRP